jgi:CheY-like chemotaxis protein
MHHKRPILVIDDDPAILETVASALRDEGYEVETAIHGGEGLTVIDRRVPALVLLDMRMPVMDGWSFARALRERGVDLPIVVMTATQDTRRWASEIGATEHLSKPFDLLDLLDVVERVYSGQA